MYHIQIVGAGYLGSRIAEYFQSKKQRVTVIVRTQKRVNDFKNLGIVARVADLTDPATLTDIPPANFVVISAAPVDKSEAGYRALYVDGLQNYLAALKRHLRPDLIVHISSTGVWDHETDWLGASSKVDPVTEKGKILAESESAALHSGLPVTVFRLAGIYGPGRNRVQSVRSLSWPEKGPDRWMNMMHVEDIVNAIPVLFKSAQVGKVYVGVDEEPVKSSVFSSWLYEKMGSPLNPKLFSKDPVRGKRCRNTALKNLDFKYKYPTFREGYTELLNQETLS